MSVVYNKNSNYWTFFHTKVKKVNSKQMTGKRCQKHYKYLSDGVPYN